MNDLTKKHCVPCEGGTVPLSPEESHKYMAQVLEWELNEDAKKIRRNFSFKDFKESMAFVNAVAALAESEGHHPDISIFYDKVRLELWTHAIGGLSENDFILAAKINSIRNPM